MKLFRLSLFVIMLSLSSISIARAQCVPAAHAQTIVEVAADFMSELLSTTLWIQYWWTPQSIQPAFAQQAKQWSLMLQDETKQYAGFVDHYQQELAKLDMQALAADFEDQGQPEEEICSRVSYSSRYVASTFKARAAKRGLLQASVSQQTSMPGTPGSFDQLSYGLARYAHFIENTCTGAEAGGALDGVCNAPSGAVADGDISPNVHFGSFTVEGNDPVDDPSTPEGPQNLHAYIENVCGGFSLSLLPPEYFDNFAREQLLLESHDYWQYEAFCRESIASVAAFKSPGNHPMTPEQSAFLSGLGFSSEQIDSLYGPNPSLQAQLDIMMLLHRDPKALGPDQMVKETSLLTNDVLNLAAEYAVVDQYQDLIGQETQNWGLFLSLGLKEQRKKANAGLLVATGKGQKS